MTRTLMAASAGILAAVLITLGSPDNASAWFGRGVNSPYIPYCRNGNCGGGDHYLGGWCRGCRCPDRSYYGMSGQGYSGHYAAQPAPAYSAPMQPVPPAPAPQK